MKHVHNQQFSLSIYRALLYILTVPTAEPNVHKPFFIKTVKINVGN